MPSFLIPHSVFSFLNSNTKKEKIYNLISFYSILLIVLLTQSSCSSSKRFTSENEDYESKIGSEVVAKDETTGYSGIQLSDSEIIRVLLNEYNSAKTVRIESTVDLISDDSKLAIINKGNEILIEPSSGRLNISILDKRFTLNDFLISPANGEKIIKIDGREFRGKIKIINSGGKLNFINQISLEDYVKGVMLKEMPSGRGNENYEALKAFSICARTYAYLKIFERKTTYDIFPDTRDQVYGGVEGESEYTNKIVDETRSQILTYNNEPAIIFYHSTCGGNTESASNVFTNVSVDYLKSIKDGSPSNCMISPRYEWTEIIPEYQLINFLHAKGFIYNKNYSIKSVKVNSRFDSGRVKEIEFKLISQNEEEVSVKLFGNNIRSVIRTADNNSILRSNYFDVSQAYDGNIVIKGKGSGHGVGLCQWGAINLSRKGIHYQEILEHYYPGTKIKKIDDK